MKLQYGDAFGRLFDDGSRGAGGVEIIERDDGHIDVSGGQRAYFKDFVDWNPSEQEAMTYVRGRCLDIGCGAGRVCLYVQEQGFDVTGIDVSPLAIEVCRRRGVLNAEVRSITELSSSFGTFDTLLTLGNNFGLFGSRKRTRWLLRRFAQ